jgi:ubiquinone/menaquinone biosynthesis C-methylase UbiE
MTTACRYCALPLTRELIDLGRQPLANNYLEPTVQAIAAEKPYPLRVMVCDGCFLVQVEESIPADVLFHNDYAYFSSFSTSWVDHARRYTEAMVERFGLKSSSKVVEVASNDGYLLQHFVAHGVPCLGVEPAGKCAAAAREKGVDTVVEFFNRTTALRLAAEGHSADLTVANNVLAHVPDIDDFVAGFAEILKPKGVATFEFPHLLRMIAGAQFDTIYHEHYSYLSLAVVERMLSDYGLRVFDVERLPTHGGSIRVFACREDAHHEETAVVVETRQAERAARLDHVDGYEAFTGRAEAMRDDLRCFLDTAKERGERVAGYGAAAKGNTFLNFCGAEPSDIAFVVDRNPEKQGKLLPGSHIPVWGPEALVESRPDAILILPWNLADEIAAEHAYVADWGGRFYVAMPTMREL